MAPEEDRGSTPAAPLETRTGPKVSPLPSQMEAAAGCGPAPLRGPHRGGGCHLTGNAGSGGPPVP